MAVPFIVPFKLIELHLISITFFASHVTALLVVRQQLDLTSVIKPGFEMFNPRPYARLITSLQSEFGTVEDLSHLESWGSSTGFVRFVSLISQETRSSVLSMVTFDMLELLMKIYHGLLR
eukprot:NODE_1073_length_1463_cov_0.132698.p3 type:complete len:120 gc:universal NODE_1073_length_1463_cov_0.132698:707-348(-)